MKINECRIYLLKIPFRFSFRHARAARENTTNIIVMIKLDNGVKGFGEAVPREYVTGETGESVFGFVEKEMSGVLNRVSFEEKDIFLGELGQALADFPPAARCAVELACLDAFSRYHHLSLNHLFRKERDFKQFIYSGVMSAEGLPKTWKMALLFKFYGLKEIKLKVGFKNDLARLKTLRYLLGPGTDIRLDVNGAWDVREAIEKIKAMRPYGLGLVEQPVEAADLIGFKKVTDESGVKTMADESLRTLTEAEKLGQEKICHSFNIRLSKCGGFLNSLKIAEAAQRYGLSFQIGCHVGETGILGAAGWHLAVCLPQALYREGCYSRFLLKEDIIREDLTFGFRGRARNLVGPGLGIEVLEDRLAKYSYQSTILKN